jgi:hypothetical protein
VQQVSSSVSRPVIKMSKSKRQDRGGRGGSAPEARPAMPSQGGAAALSSRLDKWTNYAQPHWGKPREAYRVVFRNYGDGDAEATLTIAKPRNRNKGSHRTPRDGELSPEKFAENMKRAVARAKTTIRRAIMAAKLDHLLTLTYRENMQDIKRGWSDLVKFIRLVRAHIPYWPYVAVMELQERGAIHFHLAVTGRQDLALLR